MMEFLQMQWGSFSPLHITTLIISFIAIPLVLYFTLRNRSEKTKRTVLFICSLWGPTSVFYSFFVWGPVGSYLEYLPFHMCAINALLLPVLILTKSQFLGNMLPLYSVGAGFALIFNTFQADYTIGSFVFCCYYFAHTFELCLPLLLIKFGIVKTHPRYILPSVGATFALYTLAHFVNLGVNNILLAQGLLDSSGNQITVNYMFSMGHDGNPALKFFWDIIPYPYFYMIATMPLIALAYSAFNIKHIYGSIKRKIKK